MVRLSILLRLSVLIHRRRDDQNVNPEIVVSNEGIELLLLEAVKEQVLLEADLKREKNWLEKIDFELSYHW